MLAVGSCFCNPGIWNFRHCVRGGFHHSCSQDQCVVNFHQGCLNTLDFRAQPIHIFCWSFVVSSDSAPPLTCLVPSLESDTDTVSIESRPECIGFLSPCSPSEQGHPLLGSSSIPERKSKEFKKEKACGLHLINRNPLELFLMLVPIQEDLKALVGWHSDIPELGARKCGLHEEKV